MMSTNISMSSNSTKHVTIPYRIHDAGGCLNIGSYIKMQWDLLHAFEWRHNGLDGHSNYQPHDCLLNRLFRRIWKPISKLRVTGLCEENSPVNSQHKGPVTRKMFPFDDVIMRGRICLVCYPRVAAQGPDTNDAYIYRFHLQGGKSLLRTIFHLLPRWQ